MWALPKTPQHLEPPIAALGDYNILQHPQPPTPMQREQQQEQPQLQPNWSVDALRQVCECELCQELGDRSPHNAASHDQSLDQHVEFVGRRLHIVGGTTKCARVTVAFLEMCHLLSEKMSKKKKQSEKQADAADPDEAAQARSEYADCFRDACVVEVGSGTGLVGLALAALGARVCFTDQEPVIELLTHNVSENIGAEELQSKHKVAVLQWGQPPSPEVPAEPDVVFGSDLIFAHENIEPLVSTFTTLTEGRPGTRVFLASIRRFRWEDRFFELMQERFDQATIYKHEDIEIFLFTRR